MWWMLIGLLACGDKDGGDDSGTVGGGTSDGAAGDGGTSDGGTADGGIADGGIADGGTADGGTADGGTADGGTADGGTADGGSTTAPDGPEGSVDVRDGARVLGAEAGGNLGSAVSVVGDVDGDGIGDLWIAAAEAGDTATRGGAAYLMLGPVTADVGVDAAALTVRGDAEWLLGTALAPAGDVDGDGVIDLLAGAPQDSILGPGVSEGAGPGRVLLVSGSLTGTVASTDATAELVGEEDGDKAGASVAGGDLDGDGISEVIVGAYTSYAGVRLGGAAYVLSGPLSGVQSLADADLRVLGSVEGEQLGASVRVAGDVDGDGTDDLLLGADGDEAGLPGRAYLVSGASSGSQSVTDLALASISSSQVGDNTGSTALGGTDLTGDGTADVVLCAYDAEEADEAVGAVYVMAGPFSGTLSVQDDAHSTIRGLESLAHSGEACAVPGDVDRDGVGDLLLGAHIHGVDREGRAYLFYGAPGGEVRVDSADAIFLGTVPDEDVGWAVGGGELTGDGFDDVVISARRFRDSLPAQGAVFVLPGGARGGDR